MNNIFISTKINVSDTPYVKPCVFQILCQLLLCRPTTKDCNSNILLLSSSVHSELVVPIYIVCIYGNYIKVKYCSGGEQR